MLSVHTSLLLPSAGISATSGASTISCSCRTDAGTQVCLHLHNQIVFRRFDCFAVFLNSCYILPNKLWSLYSRLKNSSDVPKQADLVMHPASFLARPAFALAARILTHRTQCSAHHKYLQHLVLECDLLALDTADHNICGIFWNDFVVV